MASWSRRRRPLSIPSRRHLRRPDVAPERSEAAGGPMARGRVGPRWMNPMRGRPAGWTSSVRVVPSRLGTADRGSRSLAGATRANCAHGGACSTRASAAETRGLMPAPADRVDTSAPVWLRGCTGDRQRLCRKLGRRASEAARPAAGSPADGRSRAQTRARCAGHKHVRGAPVGAGRSGPARPERIRQPTIGPRAQRQHAVGWRGSPSSQASARRRPPGPIPLRRPPHVRRGGVEGQGAKPAESDEFVGTVACARCW